MREQFSRRRVLKAVGSTGAAAGGFTLPAAATRGGEGDSGTEDPDYPSRAWFEREARNYYRANEAPREQASDPAFQARWEAQSQFNTAEFRQRTVEEPGWNSEGNLCREWSQQCCGDPYRYPTNPTTGPDPTTDGDDFYGAEGVRERVVFHDSGLDIDEGGARISGHVWRPADAEPGDDLPGVVITNGSIQAPETIYWWFAQELVRQGYVVLTYAPRGQGRSDTATPDGTLGTNENPSVFVTNQVDAIDLFRSTPGDYPHNPDEDVPAPVVDHNPFHEHLDRDRIGIVGHSLGAGGVSVVQGIEWPGESPFGDEENPVDVAVAWDNLSPAGEELAGRTVEPSVPALGMSADYFINPQPKTEPPDPEANNEGHNSWVEAGVDAYQINIRGGTHNEFARIPSFQTSSWEWGNELVTHVSVAWLDRWLKRNVTEPGFADADKRLIEGVDEERCERLSFYYTSKRSYERRQKGRRAESANIREGCTLESSAE